MRHPLVHPKFRNNIPSHWPSRCTIKSITTVYSQAHQKLPSAYVNVTGLVDIECRLAPFIETRITDDEYRRNDLTSEVKRRTAKLNGNYATQINPVTMVAVIDNIRYSITAVETDSEGFSTRIKLEIVTPG